MAWNREEEAGRMREGLMSFQSMVAVTGESPCRNTALTFNTPLAIWQRLNRLVG